MNKILNSNLIILKFKNYIYSAKHFVTLLRRVDVIGGIPNSKFRITKSKFAKFSPKKSNFVTKKFFLSQILWVLGQLWGDGPIWIGICQNLVLNFEFSAKLLSIFASKKLFLNKIKFSILQILWVLGQFAVAPIWIISSPISKYFTNYFLFNFKFALKRIFFKILVMRANFGDFGDFGIDFKILKKVCDALFAHIGTNFGKF